MNILRKNVFASFAAGLALSSIAYGQNDESQKVNINGFMTAGYAKLLSKSDNTPDRYLGVGKAGSFSKLSKFGLNISTKIQENLTFVAQLVAVGTKPSGADNNFKLDTQLMLLRYKPLPETSVRLGRMLLPIWLISEEIDVGVTYPWIAPPFEVYSLVPFKQTTAVDVSHSFYFKDVETELGVYFSQHDISGVNLPGDAELSANIDKIIGTHLTFNYDNIVQLRAGYAQATMKNMKTEIKRPVALPSSAGPAGAAYQEAMVKSIGAAIAADQALKAALAAKATYDATAAKVATGEATLAQAQADGAAALAAKTVAENAGKAYVAASTNFQTAQAAASVQTEQTLTGSFDPTIKFVSLGLKAEYANVLFMGEYAQRIMDVKNQAGILLIPGAKPMYPEKEIRTAYYGTIGYNIDKFMPHFTYSTGESEEKDGTYKRPANKAHSMIYGLNYTYGKAVLKAEYQQSIDTSEVMAPLTNADYPAGFTTNSATDFKRDSKVSQINFAVNVTF